ncbi:terpenoid synthase [Penicillium malachiteum]|uniref:terpenoid synthase n=1 Tax=Penicillium malachiteum TaxID=1324776 RepID=UPI002548CE9A|nr:terpenoid synthase [Penicillium malachiteum]KAJ5714510.1 terpenoid synthase [Penicillium malachiteum]
MLSETLSQNPSADSADPSSSLHVQDETLNSSQGSQCRSSSESKGRRKFLYRYDVSEEKGVIPTLEHDPFDFLDPQKMVEPLCIHWREAEAAGWELVNEVIATDGAGAVIPAELTDKRRKMLEMVETAATITIYHYAVSDAPRIRILTNAILFLFLHDGL